MMKIRASHLLIPVVTIALLFGCSALEENLKKFEVESSVEGNVVKSSSPALRLRITPELGYLGSAQTGSEKKDSYASTNVTDQGSFKAVSYLFGQTGPDERLKRGVIVRILVATGDPNQPAQQRFLREIRPSGTIDSGKMKIFDEEYRYTLFSEKDIFTEAERSMLAGKTSPSSKLIRQIEKKDGFGGKSRAVISYFEDISPGDAENLSGKEQFLTDFTERSYSAIRFIEPEKIVDATSRYADPGQSSGKGHDTVRSDASGPIEKRLQALKDLYDKNLISKEDYERKKAEILREL